MMAFNNGRFIAAAFNHIRIDRPLNQEIHVAEFRGLLFKNPDEFLPDDFPLLLRFTNPFQTS